ncbi:DUF2721 domain-containing protein [Desulfosarcina sp.]|uniref:DUF2721 domain-containing protein n=1 Tax=Desulfosarcina sp. TaxID=2027861 RepID=UPI0035612AEF
MEPIDSFVRFLQSCISPIALISGVGLILLSLTNRLARTIDKSRMIVNELDKGQVADENRKLIELKILFDRSKILRNSIVSISFSILSSSLIIPILLIMNLFDVNLTFLGVLFFLFSAIGIILSAIFLFIDVRLTLKALEFEVKDHIQ